MDDDIIRMAREAGFVAASFCRWSAYTDDLARFAALVAAAEREACAKVCEQLGEDSGYNTGQLWGRGCAAAIRARAQQPDPQVADRLARHGIPMPGDPK